MKEKKISKVKQTNDAVNYLIEKMNNSNLKETKGLMFLRTGDVIKIKKFYVFFANSFFTYSNAIVNGDEEVIKNLNGGVVTDGELIVDLSEVAMMMPHPQNEYNYIDVKNYS
jgi:hypothetical protein